jgi:phenylalanyl-tRNA synthetase alpha chain
MKPSPIAHMFFSSVKVVYRQKCSFAELKQALIYFAKGNVRHGYTNRLAPFLFSFTGQAPKWTFLQSCCGTGCPCGKYTGWIEILGAEWWINVLEICGHRFKNLSGYAFGWELANCQFKISGKDLRMSLK